MTLIQLRYFCTIVEHMSFSKAADALYISQSAMSKSIRALEGELHCDLFVRSGKKLSLSEGGKILLPYARKMVSHFDTVSEEALHALGQSSQQLHVGIPPTAGYIFFHKVVERFHKLYPQTNLVIEEGTSKAVIEQVTNMKEDLGIVIEPCLQPDLVKIPVVQSEAICLVNKNHPLASQESVAFEQLKDEPFFLISEDFMFYDLVLDKCKEAGFKPDVKFTNGHWEWIYSIVMENVGITILPYPLVRRFLNDEVRALHLKDPAFPWTLSLTYHKNRILSQAAMDFIRICQEEAGLF